MPVETQPFGGLPRPGPALRRVLAGLFLCWLVFALLINWGPPPLAMQAERLFFALSGDVGAIAVGQLWRLLTSTCLHSPRELGHIFFTLLGLYFLSPSLEQKWGAQRFLRFLLTAALVSSGLQTLTLLLLPASIAARLAPEHPFGALPLVEAVAIAWAMSFRGRTVQLFFLIPVSSTQLILVVVGGSLLAIVAQAGSHSGLVSPFGGMLVGWLLGGDPPTLRRWVLKLRMARNQRELARLRETRSRRAAAAGLRVIEGGRTQDRGDDDPPDSGPGSDSGGRVLH